MPVVAGVGHTRGMSTSFDESKIARDADGKFASTETSESDLSLDSGGHYPDEDSAFGGRETVEEVMRMAKSVARYAALSRGIDPEDLAQEAVINVLESIRHQGGKVPQNLKGYLATKTRGLAVQAMVGTSRGPDLAAFPQYMDKCREESDELGRSLSVAEEDAIAHNIMISYPPGKRPAAHFHRRVERTISFEGSYAGADMTDGERMDHMIPQNYGAQPEQFAEGSEAERVMALAEGDSRKSGEGDPEKAKYGTAADQRAARSQVWNAIVESEGVLAPGGNKATKAQRDAAKATIDHAGADVVAGRIVDGEESREEYDAFRQPWPHASRAQVVDIANALDNRSAYASDLWHAAHDASTKAPAPESSESVPVTKMPVVPKVRKQRALSNPATRDKVAAVIAKRGGAAKVAQDFLEGNLDDNGTKFFTAPWGGDNASAKTAREAAATLAASEAADAAWRDALDRAALDYSE